MFGLSPARCALAAGLATIAIAPAGADAANQADIAAAVQAGTTWLGADTNGSNGAPGYGRQSPATGAFNSGFSSFDPTPTVFAAAGRHPADVTNAASPSLQDAVFNALNDPGNAGHPTDVGAYENAILSAAASGINPARISATENLAADLASTYTDGYFGDPTAQFSGFTNTAFGALGLNRLKAPRFLVDRTISVIRQNQHDDGGWAFDQAVTADKRAEPGDVDVTGATMAALCESGVAASDPAVQDGLAFLQSTLNPATGALVSTGPFSPGPNASSNGWAISGLNACGLDAQGPGFDAGETPIDYLLGLQADGGGADEGSFLYSDPPPSFAPGPNLPATRDALRALAGGAFSAQPPARTNSADPRFRPVPSVADGTTVPIALAVDDGAGRVTLCRVSVASGASLAALLTAADSSSTPGGCATGGAFSNGRLRTLNGRAGRWLASIDGGGEQVAAAQTVRFGAFVGLRRIPPAAAAAPGAPGVAASQGLTAPAPVPAATRATTTPAGVASRSLRVSASKRVVTLSLSCARANRLCQGVARVMLGRRALGRRPFLIAGGRTTRVNVTLSRSALKRIGKKRRRVKVNVFSRDGAGIASTSSRTLTLTRTK